MVCKRCGRSFDDNSITCPFCGVGQENQINIKKLENELQKLKIEDNTSSFCGVKTDDFEIFDVEDIIDDLEDLKIKDEKKDDTPVPRVEPVSDEEIIDLIEDIKENKELFIRDKSQYQYIPKKEELDNNISINELYNKQKLYNPEEHKLEKKVEIELPSVLNLPDNKSKIFNIDYKKHSIKFKKEIILCLITLIFILSIGGVFIYKLKSSPKLILMNQLNSIYTKIQDSIDSHTDNLEDLLNNDNILVNSVSNITTNNNGVSNKEIINIKYYENKNDKSQFYEFANLNSSKTGYEKIFIKNNKLYMTEKTNADEYYMTDGRFYSILNNYESEYIIDILLDNIKGQLKDSNFKTKRITETYDSNEYKLKEHTLKVSKKLYSEIYSKFLINIKKDEDAIQEIIDRYQYSSVELMNEIDNKIEELKKYKNDDTILSFKFYTDKDGKIIKYIIEYNNYNFVLWNVGNKIDLKVIKDKQEVVVLDVEMSDKVINKYKILFKYNNYQIIGDYHEEDNKVIFNYQKNYNETNNKEIINLVLIKGIKEDNKYTNNISIAYQENNNGNITSKNYDVKNVIETGKTEYIPSPSKTKLMDDNKIKSLKERFSVFIK